jgi:hypothetical protein
MIALAARTAITSVWMGSPARETPSSRSTSARSDATWKQLLLRHVDRNCWLKPEIMQ